MSFELQQAKAAAKADLEADLQAERLASRLEKDAVRDPAARDRLLTEVGLPPGSEERTRFEGALPALEAELRAGRGLPPGTDDAVLLQLNGKLNGEGGWGVGGGGRVYEFHFH